MAEKLNVLFLCTGNSCRSQMAEGWARHRRGDVIEAYSAGIETHGLNPNAVQVMKEAGVESLVELGAGKVLSGLARRIDRELSNQAVGGPADIDDFLKTI